MSAVNWISVRDYGATGNGSTDDTSAINAAIAQLNANGKGVLYFPAGTYLVSSSLTTITVGCTVLGDGSQAQAGGAVSLINCSSTTATVFTTNSPYVHFGMLAIVNTAAGAKTAGAAIAVTWSTNYYNRTMYEDLFIQNFYIGIDSRAGTYWTARDVVVFDSWHYGIKIANVPGEDGGDWLLDHCSFLNNGDHVTDACIRLESSGAARIQNCEVLGAYGYNHYGIDVAGDGNTSVLLVQGCSFESYGNDGVRVVGQWAYQVYIGCEFGQYHNSTGSAFNLSSCNNITIDLCHFISDVAPAKAIVTSSVSNLTVGPSNNKVGFVAIGP